MKSLFSFLLFFFIAFFISCENKAQVVRPLVFSGSWYPNDNRKLAFYISSFFKEIPLFEKEKKLFAIVVPHAGFVYSGKTAAYAYRQVFHFRKQYKRIFIFAPSHRVYFNGIALPKSYTHLETPFGNIRVDRTVVRNILKNGNGCFISSDKPFMYEHSLEMQLPFLGYIFKKEKGIRIIPLIFGELTEEKIYGCVKYVLEYIDPMDSLIVATTDMVHYGKMYNYYPFHTNVLANIKKLTYSAFSFIKKDDFSGLNEFYRRTKITMCGIKPVLFFLKLLRDLKVQSLLIKDLAYSTSYDITKDKSSVVSYLSIGVYIDPFSKKCSFLSEEDKKKLLALARASIWYGLTHDKRYPPENFGKEFYDEKFSKKMGVFVTIKERGDLRGCIGYIVPRKSIFESVKEMAVNAAFFDPRFYPLKKSEFQKITLEISILTPLERVENVVNIVVGRDGLLIKKGLHQGVLLPQVPVEFGWDRIEFLRHLSLKAGLFPDAWKEADIYKFSACVFSEKEFKDAKR